MPVGWESFYRTKAELVSVLYCLLQRQHWLPIHSLDIRGFFSLVVSIMIRSCVVVQNQYNALSWKLWSSCQLKHCILQLSTLGDIGWFFFLCFDEQFPNTGLSSYVWHGTVQYVGEPMYGTWKQWKISQYTWGRWWHVHCKLLSPACSLLSALSHTGPWRCW